VQQEIDPSTANRLVKEASKCIGDASKLSSSTDTFYFPPEKDVATASKLGGEVRVSRVGPDAPYLIFDCLVVPYGIHEYYVYVRVKPGGGLSNDGTTSRVSDEIVLTVKKRAG
jgi:hypothetical protein